MELEKIARRPDKHHRRNFFLLIRFVNRRGSERESPIVVQGATDVQELRKVRRCMETPFVNPRRN